MEEGGTDLNCTQTMIVLTEVVEGGGATSRDVEGTLILSSETAGVTGTTAVRATGGGTPPMVDLLTTGSTSRVREVAGRTGEQAREVDRGFSVKMIPKRPII